MATDEPMMLGPLQKVQIVLKCAFMKHKKYHVPGTMTVSGFIQAMRSNGKVSLGRALLLYLNGKPLWPYWPNDCMPVFDATMSDLAREHAGKDGFLHLELCIE